MINKKQYFLNAHIIDPCNSISEIGGLIIDEKGKIEGSGKRVNKNNIPSREKFTDLNGKHIFPGIVDMRVFGGEPGYEYKENYRSLSQAALSGGVTSVVTMPDTNQIIDTIVDKIGKTGTLLLPTYNWDFCTGLRFDYFNSKSHSKITLFTLS